MSNYISLYELNNFQREMMTYINDWGHNNKKPIARQKILKDFKKKDKSIPTVIKSLKTLIRKGYIRVGWSDNARIVHYVQLKGL